MHQDVTTTTALMYFDADLDDSNADDSDNLIKFTDGRTLSSSTTLELDTTTGLIQREGSLNLLATAGVQVKVDIATTQSGRPLVVNADTDKSGDGVFTLAGGKVVNTNDGMVTLRAWNIALDGSLSAGASPHPLRNL